VLTGKKHTNKREILKYWLMRVCEFFVKRKMTFLVILVIVTAFPTLAFITGLLHLLDFVIQKWGDFQIEFFHNEAILFLESRGGGRGVTYMFFVVGACVPFFFVFLYFLFKEWKIREKSESALHQ